MNKLAVFVEGLTEEVFTKELISQIAGRQHVHIDSVRAFGGGPAGDRRFVQVDASKRPDTTKKYYVIIYNSCGDSRVLSDILEHYDTLCDQGFSLIIGIRDVWPQSGRMAMSYSPVSFIVEMPTKGLVDNAQIQLTGVMDVVGTKRVGRA